MLRYRRNAKGRTQKGTTKWHDDNTKPYDGGKPPALAALPASRAPRSETCSTYACLGASRGLNLGQPDASAFGSTQNRILTRH